MLTPLHALARRGNDIVMKELFKEFYENERMDILLRNAEDIKNLREKRKNNSKKNASASIENNDVLILNS